MTSRGKVSHSGGHTWGVWIGHSGICQTHQGFPRGEHVCWCTRGKPSPCPYFLGNGGLPNLCTSLGQMDLPPVDVVLKMAPGVLSPLILAPWPLVKVIEQSCPLPPSYPWCPPELHTWYKSPCPCMYPALCWLLSPVHCWPPPLLMGCVPCLSCADLVFCFQSSGKFMQSTGVAYGTFCKMSMICDWGYASGPGPLKSKVVLT